MKPGSAGNAASSPCDSCNKSGRLMDCVGCSCAVGVSLSTSLRAGSPFFLSEPLV